MNNETTDKTFLDSNQDKPRIIFRDTQILTSNLSVSSWVVGTGGLNLSQLKVSGKYVIDVFVKDNQTSRVYKLPLLTTNSSDQYELNLIFDITDVTLNGVDCVYMQFNVQKRGGAITDTYTFYTVVYSTMINEDVIIGTP